MTEAKTELREQFLDAFAGADFPVESQMDLVPALPDGPATRFEAGEVSVRAMESATKRVGEQEVPDGSVEALVDDGMAAVEANGLI